VIAALGGLALAAALVYGLMLLRRALPTAPSPFDAVLAPRGGPAKVDSLERAENVVTIAVASAGDTHFRLRPMLREIAAAGLHGRGVDLDGDPEAARTVLGEETWELVRPDRPRPENAFGPGIPADALERVLARLEELPR
jgi:hypothetical protein